MIGVTEHDVDAEIRVEGKCSFLMVVAVAVGRSMGRRPVAAVRLIVDGDSETARECEYGHQDDRGEYAAHEDPPCGGVSDTASHTLMGASSGSDRQELLSSEEGSEEKQEPQDGKRE
jgi:hypothetical protein